MSAKSEHDAEVLRQLLAGRLREAREYVGMSQDDVAAVLGVSRPAVTNLESGARKVEAVELDKLSKLYGRSVSYLLHGEAEPKDEKVAFLARATQGLTERDLDELARFAAFLRNSPKPRRKS